VYHQYTIRTARREQVVQELAAAGVQTGVHYPTPIHLQPAYRDARYGEGSLPAAEQAAREVLSLPMYPELRREQVEQVCAALAGVVAPAQMP
jgi:dTDP-4-amino-4,6-dideoxygalactose transaminase